MLLRSTSKEKFPKISRSEISDMITDDVTGSVLSQRNLKRIADRAAIRIYDLLYKRENEHDESGTGS